MNRYEKGQKVFVKSTETWSDGRRRGGGLIEGWYHHQINSIGIIEDRYDTTGNYKISLPMQVFNTSGDALMQVEKKGSLRCYTRIFNIEEFYPIPDTPPVVDKEYEALLV